MAKRGRPSGRNELAAALAELAEDKKRVAQRFREVRGKCITLNDCSWFAATILNTIESGKGSSPSLIEAVATLRQTKWGSTIHLSPSVSPRHFAESFLEKYAPNWNWPAQRDDKSRERANERIGAELARDARTTNARLFPHVTPEEPSLEELGNLRATQVATPSSWPTLRVLKLGFAVPERKIKAAIETLRPSDQEVVTIQLRRRFQGRGGFPKRYAPRIVLGLLEIFAAKWLREMDSLTSNDRKRIRASAMKVKRAISLRLKRSFRES